MNDTVDLFNHLKYAPWVGRPREMADANLIWQKAASGEGQFLLVDGDAGVGKTRFSQELAELARAAGARVMTGECYPSGSAPYAPIAQMITGWFETTRKFGDDFSIETTHELASLIPLLNRNASDPAPGNSIDAQFAPQQIFESLLSLCVHLSARSPLLIFLDDIHWADSATLYLVRNLARQSRKLRILIVLSYRTGEIDSTRELQDLLLELNHTNLATHIGLRPLNREETRDLLSSIFTRGAPEEFLDSIYRQTEGNAFFIVQVCRSLAEEGSLKYESGRWATPSIKDLRIPQTIRAAIQGRLRQLPEEVQDGLRMAAILGREFDFKTLQQAAHLDEEKLIFILETAVRKQLIAEVSSSSTLLPRFVFMHGLIPATLQESIIHIRRRKLHLEAALAIETVHSADYESLAYHYAEAGDGAKAGGYYRRAGDRARLAAPGDAARYYRCALVYLEDHDLAGKAEILANLGYCLWVVGDVPTALSCFEEAYSHFAALDNKIQSGEMQRMMGRMHWERADRALALEHYHLALAILENEEASTALARAVSSISQMYMLAPNHALAIEWGERALRLAEQVGAEDVIVHALNNIGSSYSHCGEIEKGISIVRQSLDRSLRAEIPLEACRSYYNLGVTFQQQGRYKEAREQMQMLLAYARKVFAKNYANLAIWRLMWMDWLTGKWESALAYRAEMTDFSNNLYTTWANRVFGMIDLDLGLSEDGQRLLCANLESALMAGDIQTSVSHLGQILRVYSASADVSKVVEATNQILDLVSGGRDLLSESIMPLLTACQVLSRPGFEKYSNEADSCLGWLEKHSQRSATDEAAAALAEARGCLALKRDPEAAGAYFGRSAAAWDAINHRYDQARALFSQGQALAAAGHPAQAAPAWNQSFHLLNDLLSQLDPPRREKFIQTALFQSVRLAAGHADRANADRVGDLTPREVEVLNLVAQGLTNHQVAARLGLSPLTINAHLRSIFNKLDVTTRTAAVHWLANRGRS